MKAIHDTQAIFNTHIAIDHLQSWAEQRKVIRAKDADFIANWVEYVKQTLDHSNIIIKNQQLFLSWGNYKISACQQNKMGLSGCLILNLNE